jgi:hypothetical protein
MDRPVRRVPTPERVRWIVGPVLLYIVTAFDRSEVCMRPSFGSCPSLGIGLTPLLQWLLVPLLALWLARRHLCIREEGEG